MKRSDIRNAYQQIKPDEESRERMLSQILLSSEISPAGKDERIMRKKMKPVVIAALIGLMVVLMGCAIAAMSLQDMVIGEHSIKIGEILDSEGNVVTERYTVKDVISLQGIKDSPNQLAAKEWFEYEQSYVVDWNEERDEFEKNRSEVYDAYSAYTQEMADKLDEIAHKYGLKLAGAQAAVQSYQNNILFDALGFENLHHENADVEVEYLSGYFYECGNFNMDFLLTLPKGNWAHEILLNIRYCGKEYLDTVYTSIRNIESVEQWNYTTAHGNHILIVMGEGFARFFCDRDDAFLTSGFGTDYVSESGTIQYMTKQEIELVADALDFDVVSKQPDMETVKQEIAESEARRQEALKKSSRKYGYREFIADRIKALEHPENLYYTEIDIDQNGVVDLLLGSKERCDAMWTIACDEDTGHEYMTFVILSAEEWESLDKAWPNMEIYPITTYPMED